MRLIAVCLLLFALCPYDCYSIECSSNDSPSKLWLCDLNDWMSSMMKWRQHIEESCYLGDFRKEWDELFSCEIPVTVLCCNETKNRCEMMDAFNCTVCYCTDERYINRQQYRRQWRKLQNDFQTTLSLYGNNIRYCRKSTECDVADESTTESTIDVTLNPMTPEITTSVETKVEYTTTIPYHITDSTSQQVPTEEFDTTNFEEIAKTTAHVTTGQDDVNSSCTANGFYYGNDNRKCYFAVIHGVRDVDHPTARDLCADLGGIAADILNREHEETIALHVRSQTSITPGATEVWLGMSYTPSNSIIRWSNGDEVPESVAASMIWWSSYPRSSSTYNTIQFGVDASRFGLINFYPSYRAHGVVCEI